MENKVRVLNIVPNMRSAGIENFIMNMYRNIDREKVQFDFLVHTIEEKDFDSEIESLGGKIYHLTYKDDKNIFKYIRDLNKFFKQHSEYQIVHGQMQSMMPLYLYIAKKNNVKVRIAHAHNSDYEKTIKGFLLHIFSRFSKYPANYRWACSKTAGNYLFGKKDFEIIHNAIDFEKFSYNQKVRMEIRKELGIEDKLVIGNVARFEIQKNHKFLIEIFNEIVKKNPNSILLLIGDGILKESVMKQCEEYGISDFVKFLGIRSDAEKLYQAMDVFLLPSLYEGLPLVGVEAQIAGLPCYFSSSITDEIKLSNHAKFIDLNQTSENWAKIILDSANQDRNVTLSSDYNLKKEAKRLEKKYIKFNKEIGD